MRAAGGLLAVGLLVAACGDDEGGGGSDPKELSVITYNAGLAINFVDLAEERAAPTLAAVGDLDVDILCMQEVWTPEHVELLKTEASSLENHVFLDPAQETSDMPACTDMAAVSALETCAQANCPDPPDAACALTCGMEYSVLSEDCKTCIGANFGKSLDELVSSCTTNSAKYTYEGSFGLGLMSRLPMNATDTIILESNLTRRGVLYAEIETDYGPVHTFCTHLTAALSTVQFPIEGGSWEEEQAAQIDTMLAWIDEKAAGGQIILLGDMNTGPAAGGFIAEFQENYDKFTTAGFGNSFLDDPDCTFCATNPLVDGAADESESVIIDHILLRDLASTGTVSRILDGPVTVETADGPVETRYSDHYGLRLDIAD